MPNKADALSLRFRKTRPIDHPAARYPGFRPARKRLTKGSSVRPGAMPLPCDLVMHQDVAVPMRDGIRIYVDIFLPVDTKDQVPALVSWGPYGKQGGVIGFDDLPFRGGIPIESVSGLEMFEGPDPAYWCALGYAVINVDARGVFRSEGDIHCWGRQEGRDGHDLVEWIAGQPWSNGKVGMTGTSWLAIVQWFVAAEQPPHLAAIAPCEGWSDLFRCDVVRGGIPDSGFNDHMLSMFAGGGGVEDVAAMVRADPTMNDYWRDKIADLASIRVPTYAVGSWTNAIHGIGTLNAWRGIASDRKWLRIHNSHEWKDYYTRVEDLRMFFDHFLKGIGNGWETTPRVRMAILDPGGQDIVDRAEAEFPLARTQYRSLHLNACTGTLDTANPPQAETLEYDADHPTGRARFSHTFETDTEIAGYIKLRLWVSAADTNDLDLYVEVRKLDRSGRHVGVRTFVPPPPNGPAFPEDLEQLSAMMVFTGAKGMQRASMRGVDPGRSTAGEPYHTFDKVQRLNPGEIVPVDIQIWPLGMRWHAGEQLQLLISGRRMAGTEMPGIPGPETVNRGRHVLHCGGRFDSQLILPVTG